MDIMPAAKKVLSSISTQTSLEGSSPQEFEGDLSPIQNNDQQSLILTDPLVTEEGPTTPNNVSFRLQPLELVSGPTRTQSVKPLQPLPAYASQSDMP